MGKSLVIIFVFIMALPVMAVTVPSPSPIPKLYYRIPKSKKLENKDFLTIKGKDFVLLAKRQEEKGDFIYWKTIKIRVRNEDVVKDWPYTVQQFMNPIKQKETPREPVLAASIFASPISFALLNNSRNIYAGYNLRTLTSTKHELSHDFNITENYQRDDLYDQETSSMILNTSLVYDYNNFWGNWTYFAIANYRRQKFNGDYPIKHQYGLGILGLKYKIIKNGQYIKNFDISYVPIYEELVSDFEVTFPGEEPSTSMRTLRNSFRLRYVMALGDWSLNYSLFYRPAYYFAYDILDMQDIDLNSTLSIGTSLNERVQLNFTNTYTKDIRLYRANGMRADNTINSFSINVALNI